MSSLVDSRSLGSKKSMKLNSKSLLVVIGSLSRGGCETHLLQVLPKLVDKGYEVEIFLLSWRGSLADEMERKGVKLLSPWVLSDPNKQRNLFFRLFRLFSVSLQLVIHLLRNRPQIIHFFLPAGYLIGAPIALLFSSAKRVMSRRSLNLYMDGKKGIRNLEYYLHTKMDAILGNSKAVVDQLVSQEKAPRERVGLIYNGVEDVAFDNREAFREQINIPSESLVISVVANLIPYKGHLDLLDAIAKNIDSLPKGLKLIFAGRDDGFGVKLKSRCHDLGLSDIVVFLGAYTRISELLSASDIFILPSHEEGFSNALLEAMIAGLPIIATDVGGNKEAVINEMSGLIVPSRDPLTLGAAVLRLINDEKLRKELGSAARKKALAEFTIDACVEKYDKLYMELSN